ncbi:MAG TPA: 6,7-dimethyl-8-ribityllumazine synthase [Terrimicrobiaceae bacterium]
MSKTTFIPSRSAARSARSFAIVASQYNNTYVQPLVDSATSELSELEPGAQVQVVRVPGAFEIPLAVKLVALQGKFDAILALGVVLQGETAHAELIAWTVTSALMQLGLEFKVPVIHEVLFLKNEEQAKARCLGAKLNRGIEAARAGVVSARTLREFASGIH